MPVFVASYIFLFVFGVAERNLSFVVFKVESLENVENNVHHFQELVFNLIGSAEDVCVVLGEAAHTCEAV